MHLFMFLDQLAWIGLIISGLSIYSVWFLLLNSQRKTLARLSFLYKNSALFRLASVIFLFPLHSTLEPMCDFYI